MHLWDLRKTYILPWRWCYVNWESVTNSPWTLNCPFIHNTSSFLFHSYLLDLWPCLLLLQPFYDCLDFVRDNLSEPVLEIFNHSHLSWSSIIPYLLTPSYTIHGILLVQFTCLTVFFHNLCSSFLWSASWLGTPRFILHTFLHPVIVFFLQQMPIPSQPVLL